MIDGGDVLLVGKHHDVLRVGSADGKTEARLQYARIRLSFIDTDRIIARIAAKKIRIAFTVFILLRVRSMPAQPFWQAVKLSLKGGAK